MKEALILTGIIFLILAAYYWDSKYALKYFNLAVDISCTIVEKTAFIINTLSRAITLSGLGRFHEASEEIKAIEYDECSICGSKQPKIYIVDRKLIEPLVCAECELNETL